MRVKFRHSSSDNKNAPCACCIVYDHPLRLRYRRIPAGCIFWLERCKDGIMEWWAVSLDFRPA